MLQSTIAWACGTITSLHASGWPIFSDVFYRCYSRRHNTYLQNPFNQGFLFAELIVFNSMLACLDEKVLRTRKHIYFNFSSYQKVFRKSSSVTFWHCRPWDHVQRKRSQCSYKNPGRKGFSPREKRSLTFITVLSFSAMDIDSCSWKKRKLNEGSDARLIIIRDYMVRCLATRFCLTPNQFGRWNRGRIYLEAHLRKGWVKSKVPITSYCLLWTFYFKLSH